MDKKKRKKILKQVKAQRQAARQVALDLQIPQETSKTFLTHKKDEFDKTSNDIKDWEE